MRTDANPELGPESFLGAEAGMDPWRFVQATAFVSRLDHPLVNVTVGPNHQLRQNLGAARIVGVELRAHAQPLPVLRLEAGYTHVATRAMGGQDNGRELVVGQNSIAAIEPRE